MTDYLLDTNHLSYLQERDPLVLYHVSTLRQHDRLLTTVVNVGELLRGVYLVPEGGKRRHLLNLYHRLIAQMDEVVPISLSVAEKYAEIDATLLRKGRPLPANDVWIAAASLSRATVLVTNDHHFAEIEGLTLQNWTR